MKVKVGTFNLNNLFSRYNFQATISEIQKSNADDFVVSYKFTDSRELKIRKFRGRLIEAKDQDDTLKIADRIMDMDVDVLAVQEVENIQILREFNKLFLGNLYKYRVLIEGNDPRFIDVGVLSKLPIGAVTSFQTSVHPDDPDQTVFGRDLLEVEILNESRTSKLFTLYNNHLKSHFGDDDDNGQGKVKNDLRRKRQAEMISDIVSKRQRTDGKFIIVGDMNDGPKDAPLKPMLKVDDQKLFNALKSPLENNSYANESSANDLPTNTAWTHRYKKSGQPPEFKLFDQIWLSQALSDNFISSHINRRTLRGGDGSDHDPAYVVLNL